MAALTMKDLQAQLEELKAMILAQDDKIAEQSNHIDKLTNAFANVSKGGRDRGPTSQGEMTDAHAIRVMLGDLREVSHKDAALELKLSYGQVYSARKGYTFKPVYQRMIKGELDATHDDPAYLAKQEAKALEAAEQEADTQEIAEQEADTQEIAEQEADTQEIAEQ